MIRLNPTWRDRSYGALANRHHCQSFSHGWFAAFYRQHAEREMERARDASKASEHYEVKRHAKRARQYWHDMLREQFPVTLRRVKS